MFREAEELGLIVCPRHFLCFSIYRTYNYGCPEIMSPSLLRFKQIFSKQVFSHSAQSSHSKIALTILEFSPFEKKARIIVQERDEINFKKSSQVIKLIFFLIGSSLMIAGCGNGAGSSGNSAPM